MSRQPWPRWGAGVAALIGGLVVIAVACEGPTGPAGTAGVSDPQLTARVTALAQLDVVKNLVVMTTSTLTSADTLSVHADVLQVQGEVLTNVNVGVAASTAPTINSWYAVFVATSAGGLVSPVGFLVLPANVANPTPPAGYNRFRRVGWVHTPLTVSNSPAFRWIRQTGNFVHYRPKAAPGDDAKHIARHLTDPGSASGALYEVTGLGVNETQPQEWFPPGTHEVYLKALVRAGGGGAAGTAEMFWNEDGPAGVTLAATPGAGPGGSEAQGLRHLAYSSVAANTLGYSETDCWVLLNSSGTFYVGLLTANLGSISFFVEAEGYRDESI